MPHANATMEITVHYFTILRGITGKRQEKIEVKQDSTLEDVVAILVSRYGKRLERYVSRRDKSTVKLVYLLNGKDVMQFRGMKTRLQDRDIVAMMPPIAGGNSCS